MPWVHGHQSLRLAQYSFALFGQPMATPSDLTKLFHPVDNYVGPLHHQSPCSGMLFPWEGNVPNMRYEYQTIALPQHLRACKISDLWSLLEDDEWLPLPRGCWEGSSFEKVALQQVYQKYIDVSWRKSCHGTFFRFTTLFFKTDVVGSWH